MVVCILANLGVFYEVFLQCVGPGFLLLHFRFLHFKELLELSKVSISDLLGKDYWDHPDTSLRIFFLHFQELQFLKVYEQVLRASTLVMDSAQP